MTDPKPKQKPRGAVAMGLSLHIVNQRAELAREQAQAGESLAVAARRLAVCAQRRSVAAIWLALLGWIMGGAALAAWIVEWMG